MKKIFKIIVYDHAIAIKVKKGRILLIKSYTTIDEALDHIEYLLKQFQKNNRKTIFNLRSNLFDLPKHYQYSKRLY